MVKSLNERLEHLRAKPVFFVDKVNLRYFLKPKRPLFKNVREMEDYFQEQLSRMKAESPATARIRGGPRK